jgi:hypothetical protein
MAEKIYIQVNEKVKEAKGEELENILQIRETSRLLEAEQQAKAEAKASAMAKLAALGLNEEEVNAIIGE